MIKRTLYFGNPCYLSLNNAQLILRLPEVEKNDALPESYKKEATASIAVEDIGIVILDHRQITITQALMEALLENNTALITCDNTHHPTGLMLPLCGNTIQNERFRAQLDATGPLKKQLWAQTVAQKIKNQAAHMQEQELDSSYLIPLYRNIKSGDADNCEATAAAFYWSRIFNNLVDENKLPIVPAFKRFREGLPPNNYLNYGYAILRATMARSIVGAGLLPTLGIFHHNRYNAYCLADDLMEPYRPFVDKVVYAILRESGTNEDILKDIKALLLQIPVTDVWMDGEKSPLMNATQRTAVSLVRCFNGEQRKLLYPEFI
ncbi:MAG TPA: type II CRISPR-associated endonuclease Cas1 [Bacteroidia bacterium]|nr:type II CRISPR-associated endonuclease Cas1 [Bacteroidia bacterium]